MDSNSNSNSCDLPWPKIESNLENESQVKREPRWHWTPENTLKLIEAFEECKELWDTKHPLNRDKTARQAKLEHLANMFDTTSDEVTRKLHNLRTQFNNELRKIRRKQAGGEGSQGSSGWEYFDSLSFLMREPFVDPFDTTMEGVNLALAEFQADEEVEFGLVRARITSSPVVRKPVQRVAASAPPPLPPSAHPMMWPEQPKPRIRPGINPDDCQIFGDFVSSELRTLRSDAARKKLKRIIQKAILQVEEEEDVNIISG